MWKHWTNGMGQVETGMIPREESAWHAGDVRGPARNPCSLRVVLITKCWTRIQVESCVSEPRSPRPGESHARLQRRSRMKGLIKHTDTHLRIRTQIAEAGRESRAATETIKDERSGDSTAQSFFKRIPWGTPSVGLARSYECSRQDNHMSRGIVR